MVSCSNVPDVGLKCSGQQLHRMDEMRFDLARFGLSGELIMLRPLPWPLIGQSVFSFLTPRKFSQGLLVTGM